MSSSSASTTTSTVMSTTPAWQIKLLYDSACPLCMHEVKFLKKQDAGRGLVNFVDIADDAYDPMTNGGVDFETAMGRIHAILPDGTIIKNVEVLRRVYETLGMGWVYAITKLPVIGAIANFVYGIWARWRLPLTGRPSLETVIAQRNQRLACQTDGQIAGRCRIDS